MPLSTDGLKLAPDAPIDLQTHTTYSDGKWTPAQLIDQFISMGFGLAAITDHDRVDSVMPLQELAIARNFPLLVATEMSSSWQGDAVDLLCYGFDPAHPAISGVAQDVLERQQQNIRGVWAKLREEGYTLHEADLDTILATPCVQQPHAFVAQMKQYGYGTPERSAGKILLSAGLTIETTEPAVIVEAVHQSGGVCLIAHPGRTDGFVTFDVDKLDQFRQLAPVDGIEVYYPAHTPEQTTLYQQYAEQHNLLISAGSDSHGVDHLPIPYRAELSRKLLHRLGIEVG